MSALAVPAIVLAAILFAVEVLRWTFRPQARRLRTIRKIGGRR